MHAITAHPLRRTRRIIVATALAAVALPAAAQAADVTAAGTEIVVEDRVARFGQPNRITAETLPGGELRLVDTVALVNKAASCVQVTALEVRCVRPAVSPITKLTVRTGGQGDRFRMHGSLPVRYEGGSGDDAYIGAGRAGVPTQVDFAGGGDLGDLADYSLAAEGIDVRKNERGNDGRVATGDRDNIRDDVAMVRGTRLRDILHGGAAYEVFEPQAGDDFVLGGTGITVVDMGAAPDGADRILGAIGTTVSYERRTRAVRAAVDSGGADDGEAGERDELIQVGHVIGGSAADAMLVPLHRIDGRGIAFDGGPGADTIDGTDARDVLTGGSGRDRMSAFGGDDQLTAADGEPDSLFGGAGRDTAKTDAAETTVRDVEVRTTP